jgi:hypothetical protein
VLAAPRGPLYFLRVHTGPPIAWVIAGSALRGAAAKSARQAFMTGLPDGSWAAAATAAAALIALTFLPARTRHPRRPQEQRETLQKRALTAR